MSFAMIILLPILAAFGFLYWSDQLDEEHAFLKLMFQLLFLPLILLSINFGVIYAGLVWSSDSQLVKLLADFSYYLGWIIFIVGAYIVLTLFKRIYDMILERKAQKREEKHG